MSSVSASFWPHGGRHPRSHPPATPLTIAPSSPIAFWTFDETHGITPNEVPSAAQNGIYENSALGATSAFPSLGTSVTFNGTCSRMRAQFDASFNLGTGDFRVELRYRTTVGTRGETLHFKTPIHLGIFANNATSGSLREWHGGFQSRRGHATHVARSRQLDVPVGRHNAKPLPLEAGGSPLKSYPAGLFGVFGNGDATGSKSRIYAPERTRAVRIRPRVL